MATWKFLHIACMFAAVSIFVGQGWLSAVIVGTGDVRAIRRTLAAESRFAPVGGGLFLLGITFGVITALTGDLDLTAPWLLTAYALVVLILATAMTYHAPRAKRLEALVRTSPDDEPSAELRALIDAPSVRVAAAIDVVLWLAIVFTMVTKPFE